MKKIVALLIVALLACMALPAGGRAEEADRRTPSGIAYGDIGAAIDAYIVEREAGLASCAVSVFDASGTLHTGYYGHTDIENGVEASEESVYEWGSNSKLLVWVSVMQLYERGLIDMEADIRTYLPEGFLTKLRYPNERITIY